MATEKEAATHTMTDEYVKKEKRKKDKKEKKKDTKRCKEHEHADDLDMSTTPADHSDKKSRKRDRDAKRAAKRELLEQVPKVDEDGIAYTKLQIRRMTKRVKRGLPPVPTEQEERERRRQEALDRKEEEEELAGLVVRRDKDMAEHVAEVDDADEDSDDGHVDPTTLEPATESPSTTKKSKRSKPVPSDYLCSACSNKHDPPHWIYDCPDKVTKRGTNQLSKKLRGIHNPDSKKVFVSGLPFDAKRRDVEEMFRVCGKVVSCKLLTFEDTGRCKGQAFMTFETDEGAHEALKLSGTVIDNENGNEKDSKKKKRKEERKRHDLKLKVTRVKNRSLTKKEVSS